ncbi:hypothetical protein CVIRNUC_003198 [Coccomyxa viridis]|uniref:Aminotransferase class I/classII domain-containing protein n=1 Tax=Coccomyxa viridis TaxID=1274662 RepID=A0AAV1HYQ4_9CHLO|nr:hypothetical protein CVIRNUC_003198 [Coccomyxa viridis]
MGLTNGCTEASVLSERGRQAHIKNLPMTYFIPIMDMLKNPWRPDNPSGNLILAVAENRLSCDLLGSRLHQINDLPNNIYGYAPGRGFSRLREAIAQYMKDTCLQGLELRGEDITVLAGCGAVLDLVIYSIASDGDSIGIPAPYYPAFDNDVKARCGCHAQPMHLSPGTSLSEQLDAEKAKAAASGKPMRAIIICNPNNPTGEVIPREILQEYLEWCCEHNIHLVSDEIYANSVFKKAQFVSLATILDQSSAALQEKGRLLVHTVFGLSKDWGISGLRVGWLHTLNQDLTGAMDSLAYFCMPSTIIQEAAAQMLLDKPFVAAYLQENQQRLAHSYDALTGELEKAGIPYTPAVGAIFMWVDLRAALAKPTWEAEEGLWNEVVKAGVLLTPGKACHAAEPGFFRICYAAVPIEGLMEGIRRVVSIVQTKNGQRLVKKVKRYRLNHKYGGQTQTRSSHPLGSASRSWQVDVDRVQVGNGEQTYAQAKELLDSWKHLELDWSTCALPGIQDGTVQTKEGGQVVLGTRVLGMAHIVSPMRVK